MKTKKHVNHSIPKLLTCVLSLVIGIGMLGSAIAQSERSMSPIDLTGFYPRTIASMPSHEYWAEAPDGLHDFEAQLVLDSWNGNSILDWSGVSDEQGRVKWDGAPTGELVVSVRHDRYQKQTSTLSGQSSLETIRLNHLPLVFGTVIDEETREKVDPFSVIPGTIFDGPTGERVTWMQREQLNGIEGEFQMDPRRFGSNRDIKLLIEAKGYLPIESEAISVNRFQELSFELKKGEGPRGRVILSNGEPVEGAFVFSFQKGEYFHYDGNIVGRAGQYRWNQSDSDGWFEVPAKINPLPLILTHKQGFTEVPVE